MPNEPPDHCPHCGEELESVDPPTVQYCPSCDGPVFYNPTPSARVAVLDDDRVLLCSIGVENVWETPGGRIEADEDPPVAAARELREETGLSVAPDDLTLFDVRSYESVADRFTTRLCYAVPRSATTGALRAGDEHVAVEFWTPTAFDDASVRLSDRQPTETRDPAWWRDGARAALDSARDRDDVGR